MHNTFILPLALSIFAGLCTTIGSLFAFIIKKQKACYLCILTGFSAGVMIFISFVELLHTSITQVGFLKANLLFFIGILAIYLIDTIIPHSYIEEKIMLNSPRKKKLMVTGVFIAVGIAIHNFPEGLAVAASALSSIKLGVAVTIAIALHNIPEGIAISIPIYYATKNRKKAFFYSFLSGVAEPIGAVLGLFILLPFLNETMLFITLSFVAGVMVYISFDELLPIAFKKGEEHKAILGIFLGMLIMALSLYFL